MAGEHVVMNVAAHQHFGQNVADLFAHPEQAHGAGFRLLGHHRAPATLRLGKSLGAVLVIIVFIIAFAGIVGDVAGRINLILIVLKLSSPP
jgi:hypothetical protein